MKIAVLMASYNRRETTLRALRALETQRGSLDFKVFLVDDASSDGTADAVGAEFPEVDLILGSGEDYWNGALHRAWSRSAEFEWDGYLWLNDDVELFRDALSDLELTRRDVGASAIIVGSTVNADGEITYSGLTKVNSMLSLRFNTTAPDGGKYLKVDTFHGNFVYIPRAIAAKIGINDPKFLHNFGDIDYGLRASKAGISIFLMKRPIGLCEYNAKKVAQGFGGQLTLRQQWAVVQGPHGLPPRSWLRLTRRHSGWRFPIHFLLPYRHLFLPKWPK